MRDRETDSWWSIMTANAIGGELHGTELVQLPFGEKTTWGDWVARHPDTLVLSVDGREHLPTDPYADYFASDRTFRDLEIDDRRLQAKTPVFAFRIDELPYAAPHAVFEGGRLLPLDDGSGRAVLLHRPPGAELLASSRAFLVSAGRLAAGATVEELLELAGRRAPGFEALGGFDTFWYSWVAIHGDSRLLR